MNKQDRIELSNMLVLAAEMHGKNASQVQLFDPAAADEARSTAVKLRRWAEEVRDQPTCAEGWEQRAVELVLMDLGDRRGIKSELHQIDDAVMGEIKDTMAGLIKNAAYAETL